MNDNKIKRWNITLISLFDFKTPASPLLTRSLAVLIQTFHARVPLFPNRESVPTTFSLLGTTARKEQAAKQTTYVPVENMMLERVLGNVRHREEGYNRPGLFRKEVKTLVSITRNRDKMSHS